MKIIVARKEFADALKNVLKAVAVKSQTPILSGIYLKAENSTLELQATNNSVGIISKVPAVVEEDGEIVILGKKLFEIVQKLSGDTLTITADDKDAEIKSAGTKYNLLVFKAEDFPKIKQEENLQRFKLLQSKLKRLIKQTAYAAADDKDTSRTIFTGVLFNVEGEKLTLAATNTHRLAVVSATLDNPFGDKKVIVPAKILQEISAMSDDSGMVEFAFTEKNAIFVFDNLFVTTRLISGDFPNFSNLLNLEHNIFVKVNPEEFLQALERVSVIAKETDYEMVALLLNGDGLKISSTSAEVGTAEEFVSAEVEGGELDIAFNYNYLTDVLKVIDAEKIEIGMSGTLKPIDFQLDNFRYIVTPVRRN